ncbi:L-threonylcarbamoyladenylate synthase [Nocardioides gilvus]|uniref:L-threonylcarbamoyladenylate synthase n=1 Tax=Nocardioides gilvus TaxID=1735589 RepID=UPI000D7414C2|nr:L-threonylcarbamoyladenylate synthase [Nocardioides gilvus]
MSTMQLSTGTETERDEAMEAATQAVRRGELVVIPTDTVYGIGADAFDASAVTALLAAKGRGRDMPPPVLVSSATTLDALATEVPEYARALVSAFWPGPLTLVCRQQASLKWDLGETRGTVAVRMPDHEIALGILERTGPLAVSSANLSGEPAARDADEATAMLGESVAVVVDAGRTPGADPSTIVDVTGKSCRVLRVGAVGVAALREVLDPLAVMLVGEGVVPETPAEAPYAAQTDPESADDPDAEVAPAQEDTEKA